MLQYYHLVQLLYRLGRFQGCVAGQPAIQVHHQTADHANNLQNRSKDHRLLQSIPLSESLPFHNLQDMIHWYGLMQHRIQTVQHQNRLPSYEREVLLSTSMPLLKSPLFHI